MDGRVQFAAQAAYQGFKTAFVVVQIILAQGFDQCFAVKQVPCCTGGGLQHTEFVVRKADPFTAGGD